MLYVIYKLIIDSFYYLRMTRFDFA